MGAATIGQRGATAADMIGRRQEAMIAGMAAAMIARPTLSAAMATGDMTEAILGSMTVAMTGDMLLRAMGKSLTTCNAAPETNFTPVS